MSTVPGNARRLASCLLVLGVGVAAWGLADPVRSQLPPGPPPAGPPSLGSADGSSPSPGNEVGGLVLGVRVVGLQKLTLNQVLRNIKTKKDREYDPQLLQEDVRRLYATRKFQDVRVHREPGPHGVFVTIEVLERPTLDEIKFIGNRQISDHSLVKQSGLKVGDAVNIYSVQEARRKVEDFYHSKGFPETTVSILEGDKPGQRRVVLLVQEGKVERIWRVRFLGNDPALVTDARLATLIQSKPGILKYLFRGKVDRDKIDEDVERLTAYYRGLGYFRARIGRELEFDSSGQWLTLTFVIDEGPRYRVRNVAILGNQRFDSESLKALLELHEGDYFNQAKMLRDELSLKDAYGSAGHVFAEIKAQPRYLEEPGLLDLVYQVQEGDVFRVGKINIVVSGEYPHTRQDVVLNRLSLRPGDIVDIRKVRESERRLKSSQLFETNPAEGDPPRIVIRPPNADDVASKVADRPSTTYRGQSPDGMPHGPRVRNLDLDVILPPLRDRQP